MSTVIQTRKCTHGTRPQPPLIAHTNTAADVAATWGLKQHVLERLESDPPPALRAVHTRLQALYPEYAAGHMPAAALSAPEDEGPRLSAFVGNAVMHGDPCEYHIDMDPASVAAGAPWVDQLGWCAPKAASLSEILPAWLQARPG